MTSESKYQQMALLACLDLDLLAAAIMEQPTLKKAQDLVRSAVARKNELLCDPVKRQKAFQEAKQIFTLEFDEKARKLLERATKAPRFDEGG